MITGIDHIVLTVDNIDKSIFFYRNVLGMTLKEFHPTGKEKIRYSLNFFLIFSRIINNENSYNITTSR